ncbi:MAG: thioredoxin [Calditrichaeota bacterium]|nr:thioredoxin [Calditrichota bacterium]MCB0314201.1 thioredoxin [Calditrichota bacterium]
MTYDSDNFQQDVIERSHQIPVLVDFWAEWCGPCKILGPVLERLAEKHRGSWALVKINTEKHHHLAAQYGIRSIPNVKLFVDGEVANEFVGALPEAAIEQWLKKALPSPYREKLAEVEHLLAGQQLDKAEQLLEEVIGAEPDNARARVLLAQLYLDTDPQKVLDLLEGVLPGSEYGDIAEALRTFAGLTLYLKNPEALPESPVKQRYLQAIRNLAGGDFTAALEDFIELLQSDRYYDDDGPRKACIAIFKLLGEDHETTRHYRPLFSRALYV